MKNRSHFEQNESHIVKEALPHRPNSLCIRVIEIQTLGDFDCSDVIVCDSSLFPSLSLSCPTGPKPSYADGRVSVKFTFFLF